MTAPRFALAYAMDWLIGDPEWFPHPVRWFGKLIRFGERWLKRDELSGAALTCSVVTIAWGIGMPRNATWQVLLAWTTLATRSLLRRSVECDSRA